MAPSTMQTEDSAELVYCQEEFYHLQPLDFENSNAPTKANPAPATLCNGNVKQGPRGTIGMRWQLLWQGGAFLLRGEGSYTCSAGGPLGVKKGSLKENKHPSQTNMGYE